MAWCFSIYYFFFRGGGILGMWIFVNLWSSFLFSHLGLDSRYCDDVEKIQNSTWTAFWRRNDMFETWWTWTTWWNGLSQGNLIGAFSYFGSGSEDFYVELLTTVTHRTSRLQPISVQHILTALCRLQGRVAGEKLQGPLDMLCEAWQQLQNKPSL